MKPWVKVFLITVALAIPAMMLGRVIWPPSPEGPEPTSGQLPFFIGASVIEAIAFGLGVAFLIFGFGPLSRAMGGSKVMAWAAYLSIGWLLVSWWPHDNLHLAAGEDMQAILYLVYGFHMSLIVAGVILAYSFATVIRNAGDTQTATVK